MRHISEMGAVTVPQGSVDARELALLMDEVYGTLYDSGFEVVGGPEAFDRFRGHNLDLLAALFQVRLDAVSSDRECSALMVALAGLTGEGADMELDVEWPPDDEAGRWPVSRAEAVARLQAALDGKLPEAA